MLFLPVAQAKGEGSAAGVGGLGFFFKKSF